MNKNELSSRLSELKSILTNLSDVKEYLFDNPLKLSAEEMSEFKLTNKDRIERFAKIISEIKDIEWQLLSDREKHEKIEIQQKIKDKYSND